MRRLLFALMLLFSPFLSAGDDDEAQIDDSEGSNELLCKSLTGNDSFIETPIAMANLDCEPSAIVHGVNVITGDFCSSCADLVVYHGVDPIVLERNFCSSNQENAQLGAGWTLNHYSHVTRASVKEGKVDLFTQDHGGVIYFNGETIIPRCYAKSVTNNSTGYISGQTNIKNQRLKKFDKGLYHLNDGAGVKKI